MASWSARLRACTIGVVRTGKAIGERERPHMGTWFGGDATGGGPRRGDSDRLRDAKHRDFIA